MAKENSFWAKVFGSKDIDENSSDVEKEQAVSETLDEKDARIAELEKQLEAANAPAVVEEVKEKVVTEETTKEVVTEDAPVVTEEVKPAVVDLTEVNARITALEASTKAQGETITTLTSDLKKSNQALATLKAKGVQAPSPSTADTTEDLAKAIDTSTASGSGVRRIQGQQDYTERRK